MKCIIVLLIYNNFFKNFNFDTLLALISCVAAVIALFVSGKTYYKINKNYKSLNSSNIYKNNSMDNSQKAGRDIINNGINNAQLEIVTKQLVELTGINFSSTLSATYEILQKEHEKNIHNIIDETKKLIEEYKLDVRGYTKIDWINIYLENAKITCDKELQKLWAKVLAKELSQPNSISFKTIDVLKSISIHEYDLMKKIVSISLSGIICKGKYLDDIGFTWTILQRMKEFGLISLDSSKRTIDFDSENEAVLLLNNQYLIKLNSSSTKKSLYFECYLLSNSTKEMADLLEVDIQLETAKIITKHLIEEIKDSKISFSLHKIIKIENQEITYDDCDLLKESSKKNL